MTASDTSLTRPAYSWKPRHGWLAGWLAGVSVTDRKIRNVDEPIWLRFMFPNVPGFGSRIWTICVIRAFGWLTGTRHAA